MTFSLIDISFNCILNMCSFATDNFSSFLPPKNLPFFAADRHYQRNSQQGKYRERISVHGVPTPSWYIYKESPIP